MASDAHCSTPWRRTACRCRCDDAADLQIPDRSSPTASSRSPSSARRRRRAAAGSGRWHVRAGMALATSGVVSMPRPVARPAFDSPTRNAPSTEEGKAHPPATRSSRDGRGFWPPPPTFISRSMVDGVPVELEGQVQENGVSEHDLGDEGVDRRTGPRSRGRLLDEVAHASRLVCHSPCFKPMVLTAAFTFSLIVCCRRRRGSWSASRGPGRWSRRRRPCRRSPPPMPGSRCRTAA